MPSKRPPASQMALTAELVALCERPVPEPGPRTDVTYFSEAEYLAAAEDLAAAHGDAPIWVFAYGSLIWNPGFTWDAYRRAALPGWHRSFSLRQERWRGTPEQPGLMLALERGGTCVGIAFRLPQHNRVEELANLLKREIDGVEDMAYLRWLDIRAEGERHKALIFYADPNGDKAIERPKLETVAHTLARACGHLGSGAAYLHRTVEKLAEHGIHDRNLWRLQEMVAAEILALRG
ncbi:MAG: gamma-glutamylcyclotransferase [Rhodospirillaceae bacterium]|nr:gamma-glutamylcyclotransferase [Rhodospirillaceae bacterium]